MKRRSFINTSDYKGQDQPFLLLERTETKTKWSVSVSESKRNVSNQQMFQYLHPPMAVCLGQVYIAWNKGSKTFWVEEHEIDFLPLKTENTVVSTQQVISIIRLYLWFFQPIFYGGL